MGFFLIIGLGVFVSIGLLLVGSLIGSLVRCRAVPLYWIVSFASLVSIPMFLYLPFHSKQDYRHGWVEGLLDSALSGWSIALFVAGSFCVALVANRHDWVRALSGVSWGFVAVFVLRVAKVFGA